MNIRHLLTVHSTLVFFTLDYVENVFLKLVTKTMAVNHPVTDVNL